MQMSFQCNLQLMARSGKRAATRLRVHNCSRSAAAAQDSMRFLKPSSYHRNMETLLPGNFFLLHISRLSHSSCADELGTRALNHLSKKDPLPHPSALELVSPKPPTQRAAVLPWIRRCHQPPWELRTRAEGRTKAWLGSVLLPAVEEGAWHRQMRHRQLPTGTPPGSSASPRHQALHVSRHEHLQRRKGFSPIALTQ